MSRKIIIYLLYETIQKIESYKTWILIVTGNYNYLSEEIKYFMSAEKLSARLLFFDT